MKQHIVILGGGISGLAAAYFLQQKHGRAIRLTIVEKSPRLGGCIETITREGFRFDQGPHSYRASKASETFALIQALELEKEVVDAHPSARRRYLWINEKLHCLPNSPFSFLWSPLTRNLLPALVKEWGVPPGNGEETIYGFMRRRFNEKAANVLVDPLTSGIYAGDIRKLSFQSCFPQLFQWEQEHRSILKGMFRQKRTGAKVFSFRKGMETLIHALKGHLDAHIALSCDTTRLEFQKEKIHVHTSQSILKTDHVISALPTSALSQLFASHHPHLANLFDVIPSTSLAVVNVGYHKLVLKQQGFGYLIPSQEKEQILGCIWDSSVFPEQNQHPQETRLTVMIGGEHMKDFSKHSEEDFKKTATEALANHLHIQGCPDVCSVKIARNAIPQYTLGHGTRVKKIEEEVAKLSSRLTLLGNSFYGVSINDCITTARKKVEAITW